MVEGSIKTTTTDVCHGKTVILLALLGTHDKIKVSDKCSLVILTVLVVNVLLMNLCFCFDFIQSYLEAFVERANSFKEIGVRDNICVIMSAPNPEEQTTGKWIIYSLSEY